MPSLFPSASALSATFGSASPYKLNTPTTPRTPYQARSELYPSWGVAEDAQKQSAQLSNAAIEEVKKASSIAQAKAGKIELYSGKYYASKSSHHRLGDQELT
jgi:solute carrier family 25 (mitochondrial phosphate transporter), member 3